MENKKQIILNLIFRSLRNIIRPKKNTIFHPGWKKIKAEEINNKHFNSMHRIVESYKDPSFKSIEIKDDSEKLINEDIYPLK